MTAPAEATNPAALKQSDRCDRCSAQAYVETKMPSGFTLLWCAHHFSDVELDIMAKGGVVSQDTRGDLAVKRESGFGV